MGLVPAPLRGRRGGRGRARRPHHLYAYRLDAHLRRRRWPRRARSSASKYGATVPARRADRLQDEEGRAGRARGDPADRRSSTTRRRCARCGRAARAAGATSARRDDLLRLYTLIWNRFVACQMVPAVFDQTTIDIAAGRAELRASGQVMKFPGFLVGLRRDGRGRRQRGRDRRGAARRQGRRDDQAARDPARAALHAAAAAILGGDAGQGAGGEGDRPPVDLRGDPVDGPGPRLRREEGGAPPPDRARA